MIIFFSSIVFLFPFSFFSFFLSYTGSSNIKLSRCNLTLIVSFYFNISSFVQIIAWLRGKLRSINRGILRNSKGRDESQDDAIAAIDDKCDNCSSKRGNISFILKKANVCIRFLFWLLFHLNKKFKLHFHFASLLVNRL